MMGSKFNVISPICRRFCSHLCCLLPPTYNVTPIISRPFSRPGSKSYCVKIAIGIVPVLSLPKVYAENISTQSKENENAVKVTKDDDFKDPEIFEDQEKSGWDRLRAVYQLDEFGYASKELNATFQGICMACIVGFLYGGVKSSREALIDFMERNQATIFENPTDAKRRLQNHVTVHFAKGATKWGSRLAFFTGGFMLILMSLSAYRGQQSVIDYTLSGTLIGAVTRLRLGPRGMIVGGVIGSFMGLFCGVTTKTLLNLHGTSLDDVISFQYEIEKSRRNLFKEAVNKDFEKNEMSKEVLDLIKNREVISEEK